MLCSNFKLLGQLVNFSKKIVGGCGIIFRIRDLQCQVRIHFCVFLVLTNRLKIPLLVPLLTFPEQLR